MWKYSDIMEDPALILKYEQAKATKVALKSDLERAALINKEYEPWDAKIQEAEDQIRSLQAKIQEYKNEKSRLADRLAKVQKEIESI